MAKAKKAVKPTGLYRRNDSPVWWVDITTPDGKRHRASTGTEDVKAAMEYRDRLKVQLWEEKKLGKLPEYLWEDAVKRFLKELKVDGRDDYTIYKYEKQLQWWGEKYFGGKPISTITKGDIMEGIYAKAEETSPATANRYLAPIRAMLYRAVDPWGWLKQSPTRFKQFSEQKFARKRSLKPDEIVRLAEELPEHQSDMFLFSVATGLRVRNVVGLKWQWIDMQRRVITIPGAHIKNREDFEVALNESALAIIRRQIGKHTEHVFTYRGKPINQPNGEAWRNALKRAGIEDYRYHDNRHTFATNLRRAGVDLGDIKDLGGWKTDAMVRRYATPDLEVLREKSKMLDSVLSQIRHKA